MATRATIIVEGVNYAKVYKHFDGAPESTLPWLESFNNVFTKKRGDDPAYKFAQLLRSSALQAEQFRLDASTETGWGVVEFDSQCLEEYEYTLHRDGRVSFSAV